MRGFLKKELRGFDLVVCFVAVLVASILWGTGLVCLKFGSPGSISWSHVLSGHGIGIGVFYDGGYQFFFWKGMKEEIVFRVIPLAAIVWLTGHFWLLQKADVALWLIVVIAASAVFGVGHGDHSWFFVALQGTLGALWSIVYLICGGSEGKVAKPFLMTASIHATYNVTLLLLFR